MDVQIDVVDRANNPPVWTQSIYGPIYIKENLPVGAGVISVKARSVVLPDQTLWACLPRTRWSAGTSHSLMPTPSPGSPCPVLYLPGPSFRLHTTHVIYCLCSHSSQVSIFTMRRVHFFQPGAKALVPFQQMPTLLYSLFLYIPLFHNCRYNYFLDV